MTGNGPTAPIVAYAVGLARMSLCAKADVAIEDVERYANEAWPTGIKSRWRKSPDANFADGRANGCDCNKFSGRRHWLLHC